MRLVPLRDGMELWQVLSLVLIFACVTPVGVAIGIGVGSKSSLAALILEGLAAGTFIYIGGAVHVDSP
jgi:zinc transporter 1/2/3